MTEKKIILITGASSGIGKACAVYLTQKGYKVYGTSRKNIENTIFTPVIMDVTDTSSVTNSIHSIIEKEGRIDILVNNAGIGLLGALEDTSIEEAKNIFETNFFGVMRMCQDVLPQMRKQNSGLIINIGSLAGLMGLPFRSIYCASKYALEGLTESLRLEVAHWGIKVIMIEPGDVNTAINTNRNVAAKANEQSIYHKGFEIVSQIVHQEVEKGCKPEKVAKLVEKIIIHPNPKVRYKVGLLMQKASVLAKNILPSKTFEKMMKRHYGMK